LQYNEVNEFMSPVEKKEQELSVSELPSHQPLDDGERSSLLEPFILIAKHKFFTFYFVAGAALLSAVIAMLLPQYYTANAKIMPPQQSQSMASAVLSQLGQLGPLIGAGKDLGMHNPNDMYMSMIRSRTVADSMIDRFSLMRTYGKQLRVDARQQLDDRTAISSGKDGMISISVDDRSPARAAEMANAYIDELEKLTRTLAVTDAAKKRLFFEGEVKTANDELATAELSLKRTEESTGIIQLDSQSKVMLQTYADLRAQIGSREVQVQSMRSFATPENPDLMRAEQELNTLRGQLAHFERGQNGHSSVDLALEKVPGAGLEYVRKLREVKYRETLFELLAKQYEAARIDEARDASVIQVLDRAMPPEKRSSPKRGLIVELATLLALLLTIPLLYVLEALRRVREEPQSAPRWQLLKMYLHSGRKPFNRIVR
jgi:tyrosine-protein kinase Etk/Wzc